MKDAVRSAMVIMKFAISVQKGIAKRILKCVKIHVSAVP
jgi:hypothetical protein